MDAMMNCTQTSICLPNPGPLWKVPDERLARTCHSSSQSSYLHVSSAHASASHNFQHYKAFPKLVYSASRYKRCSPVCMYGGKGNSKNENEAFSWESLKKAMEDVRRKQSTENLFLKKIQEWKFNRDGGGRKPPGGGGDDSHGPADGNFAGTLDELLQVILATIGFIFVYICLVRGEELTRLAMDYIKYLLGAKASLRLRRAMDKWRRFSEAITWKEALVRTTKRCCAWNKPKHWFTG